MDLLLSMDTYVYLYIIIQTRLFILQAGIFIMFASHSSPWNPVKQGSEQVYYEMSCTLTSGDPLDSDLSYKVVFTRTQQYKVVMYYK